MYSSICKKSRESNRRYERVTIETEKPEYRHVLTHGPSRQIPDIHNKRASLWKMRRSHLVFDVLSEMKNRVSTNRLDKVAGLGYILDLKYLPMYDSSRSEEDSWATLVDAMFRSSQATLLFLYPEPGNRIRCWCPSWKQIMTKTLPSCKRSLWDCSPAFGTDGYERTVWITDEDGSADSYRGYQIDSGYVQGLSSPSYNDMPRQRGLVVKHNTGTHIQNCCWPHIPNTRRLIYIARKHRP